MESCGRRALDRMSAMTCCLIRSSQAAYDRFLVFLFCSVPSLLPLIVESRVQGFPVLPYVPCSNG